MKKNSILLTLIVLWLAALGTSAHTYKQWDFTKGISDETYSNMAIDQGNWSYQSAQSNPHWRNETNQGPTAAWSANGTPIAELDGLRIDLGNYTANALLIYNDKMRLSRDGTVITFPKMYDGQMITIVGRSANSTATNRGIEALTDGLQFAGEESSEQTNGQCMFLGANVEGSERNYTFVWRVQSGNANGIIPRFKVITGGIDFLLFHIEDVYNAAIDRTARVGTGTGDWTGSHQTTDPQYAPMVYTADGRHVNMVETYVQETESTGTVMWQSISGLTEGVYELQLYANANYTDGRGFDSELKDWDNSTVIVHANSESCGVDARIGTNVRRNGIYRLWPTVGSDGTLRIGMTKLKPGTNWHTLQIKSLTLVEDTGNKPLHYEVNEVADGQVMRTTSGEAAPGTEVVVPYRYYVLKGGQLYRRKASGGDKGKEFNHYFTLNEETRTDLYYDPSNIGNVVFLTEGEELPGMTRCTSDNARLRSSNAAAGYAAGGNVAITYLQPGTYRIGAVLFDATSSLGSQWTFVDGQQQTLATLQCSTINFHETTSDAFTISQPTTIYVKQGGDYRTGIDLLYIVQEDYYQGVEFTVNKVKYHSVSDNEVEVVGEDGLSGNLIIPATVTYENKKYQVTSIAPMAFANCKSITIVTLGGSVTTIGDYAFAHSSATRFYISTEVSHIGDWAFLDCANMSTISVASGNKTFCSESNVLFDKDKTRLIYYAAAQDRSYYDIPTTVSTIESGAFDGASKLEYISVPGPMNTGLAVFAGCTALKTIVCLSAQPVGSDPDNFAFADEVYNGATLWVPAGATASYRAHQVWKRFSDIRDTPSEINITANNYEVEYGEKMPSLSFQMTEGPVFGSPSVRSNAPLQPNAGIYVIRVVTDSLHTVCKVNTSNGQLTVGKAPIDVSVGHYTMTQGQDVPAFTISYSGFKYDQDESVLTRKATASCSATRNSAAGDYPIRLSGAQADNYSFVYHEGTLTVVAANAIVITARSYTISYGEAVPKFEYDVTGGTLSGTPVIVCSCGQQPGAGQYDIIVGKGTVSNLNVTYVKGTLTVNKATLNVSVDNYTRSYGEENPYFSIKYSGFQYGEGAGSLTQQPTAVCEATRWSPPGTYPITITGGASPNYNLRYTEGTLTVKNQFNMTVIPIGSGVIRYGSSSYRSYQSLKVSEGEDVKLTFLPDTGFELQQVLLNGNDITGRLQNGAYTFRPTEDVNVMATFVESVGSFTDGGIKYTILSAPNRTVVVDKGTYSGHVYIPPFAHHDNNSWTVVGIADNAFNNQTRLVSIDLPETLQASSIGISLFTGCTSLAAIIWNSNAPLTQQKLGVVNNPNLLFYTSNRVYAPSNIGNIVVNGTANSITLQDAEEGTVSNFYCPQAFNALKISYSHTYGMESGLNGEVRGWETIALPFAVQKVEHSEKGTLVPFARYDANKPNGLPFWLYRYGNSGFVRATQMDANRAYIICMPNNSEYEPEYNLAGRVTFSAENARVERSANIVEQVRGIKRFVPAFCQTAKSASVYAMNIYEGSQPGSAFVSNLRNVNPFEGYMTTDAAGARPVMEIDFEDATGIADLTVMPAGGAGTIHTLDGMLIIRTGSAAAFSQALGRLPAGVYIVNGKKQQIKH